MSPRHVARSVSAIALVLGLAPCTLAAQSSTYTTQLQGYMNNYSGPILGSGFQAVTAMVTNGINGGATANHPVTMNAGRQYVILGTATTTAPTSTCASTGPTAPRSCRTSPSTTTRRCASWRR